MIHFFKKYGFFNIFLCLCLISLASCKSTTVPSSLLKDKSNPVVKMKTSQGDIFIELFQEEAPITVENFLNYVSKDFYDGTIFHRVVDDFIIEAGGFEPGLSLKKTQSSIKNEAINGLSNTRGTIAMERGKLIDSATSQFFINVNDNTFLDHVSNSPHEYGYAVFGRVVEGMNIVDKIRYVETTDSPPYKDVPITDVLIEDIIVIKK